MTPNRVKLGRAVTFMKYLTSVVSLIFLPKTLSKFSELCRADEKLACEEYLQENLPILLFLSNLSLLIVKILKAYN